MHLSLPISKSIRPTRPDPSSIARSPPSYIMPTTLSELATHVVSRFPTFVHSFLAIACIPPFVHIPPFRSLARFDLSSPSILS
ncbi:hypothetical protein VTO73DRAFT_673 [Trametes versicolor]